MLNKPAGLVVHPATGHQTGTLVNGLLAHAPEMSRCLEVVLCIDSTRTPRGSCWPPIAIAHKILVAQLADRSVSRIYSAVCRGTFTGGGTIDAPIGRHPTSRLKMAVVEDGKPSRTHYRIEKRFRAHTHLSVSLETGRTHQIRVHLAWRKHPLVGDPVYAGRAMRPAGASDQLVAALAGFRRQALHARQLTFLHPQSQDSMTFETPIPADMAEVISVFRAGRRSVTPSLSLILPEIGIPGVTIGVTTRRWRSG